MSRCQHGQKISLFCIHEGCTWRESGGCEKCFKKYHDHLTSQYTLSDQQLDSVFKKTVLKSDVKFKSRPLQQAIYNYFMIMKSQITSSIDAVSRGIINRISHPYLFREGQLGTYKKIKSKEYKKINKKELINFYHFSNKLSLQDFEREQKKMYLEQTQNIINSINEINQVFISYSKAVASFDSTFNIEQSFYTKIAEISESIMEIKQQSTNSDNEKKQISQAGFVVPEIKTSEVHKQEAKIQNISENKRGNFLGVNRKQSIRDRKVSIDVSFVPQVHKFTQSVSYDENEKKIQAEKRKLLQLLDSSKKKKEPSNEAIKTELPKSNETPQRSQKIEQKRERVTPLKLDFLVPKVKELTPEVKKQEESQHKQQVSSNKSEDSHKIQNELRHDEQQGTNLLAQLIGKGINIPQMIVHTILPRVDSKKKLYEHTEEVKEKKIVIPVRQYEGVDEISSPILKKRKKDKGLNLQLKVVSTENQQNQEIRTPQKKIKESKEEQEKLQLKQKQANSLALLVQSLPLPAEKAIPLLETALKYAHNNLSAAEYLSYLYLEIGKPKKCLDLCNQILQQMEDSPQYNELSIHINNNKAASLNLLGRYSESISILQKCLQYCKKDIFYKNLADAYYSIGIYEKAIYNYENAVSLNHNLDEAHYNLAVCLFQQQNNYHAQLSINKALKLVPENQNYKSLNNQILKRISTV